MRRSPPGSPGDASVGGPKHQVATPQPVEAILRDVAPIGSKWLRLEPLQPGGLPLLPSPPRNSPFQSLRAALRSGPMNQVATPDSFGARLATSLDGAPSPRDG